MAERILVTGVSGFIAKHVALCLLRAGYEVRGTVRSLKKGDDVRKTLEAAGADIGGLSFAEADLTADAGWREAVEGCVGVMHVASPFPIAQPRDRFALTPAARDGALRVIGAALDVGAKRIVMTSSLAAMMYRANRPAVMTVGENEWTDVNWSKISAYVTSKTEAERAAWAFVEERDAKERLVAVNPGFVLGPALDKDFGASLEVVKLFLTGAYPAVPPASFPTVDVRDVAELHLKAFESPQTGGRRLIAAADTVSLKEMALVLKEAAPDFAKKIPTRELPAFVVRLAALFDRNLASIVPDLGTVPKADAAYVTELTGVRPRPAREAIAASARSLIELGVV